jgi:hypothetical protein
VYTECSKVVKPNGVNCCLDDVNAAFTCQKTNCELDECKQKSISCVNSMITEYNDKISKQTGHKIKGWSIKNLTRHEWNGWKASRL